MTCPEETLPRGTLCTGFSFKIGAVALDPLLPPPLLGKEDYFLFKGRVRRAWGNKQPFAG